MDKLWLVLIGFVALWWLYGRYLIARDEAELRALKAQHEMLRLLKEKAKQDAHELQKQVDTYNDVVSRSADTLRKYGIDAKPLPGGGPSSVTDSKV